MDDLLIKSSKLARSLRTLEIGAGIGKQAWAKLSDVLRSGANFFLGGVTGNEHTINVHAINKKEDVSKLSNKVWT